MAAPWEKSLERWRAAGLIDPATAQRVRAYEAAQAPEERLRWPVLLALALGGLLLCAGILLFVAAHWDELSPAARFGLVLFLVAAFPIAGAATAQRFPALSVTFHAIGTICVGAGIFLTAQIFNLQEHWPNGILLWAVGALVAWIFLRHWTQAALLSLLVPMWLSGEWFVRSEFYQHNDHIVFCGLLLLAFTYLSARSISADNPVRKALAWIGGLSLLPLACATFVDVREGWWWSYHPNAPSFRLVMVGWIVAIGLPLLLAFALRREKVWMNVVSAVWVLGITTFHSDYNRSSNSALDYAWNQLGPYFWAALGAVGLIAWGVIEQRKERINLGVAGFALTTGIFYFSDVMDKLGRSSSLIGLGILLLFGGWVLEKTRRRLIASMQGVAR